MHHMLTLSIFALFVLLAIAVLMLPLTKRIGVPYTVFLAVIGIGLGFVLQAAQGANLGVLGDFLEGASSFSLTSEVIFFVFLPALVFESALAIDARRLMADIWPILFLAVVGLLLSSFLVGGAVWSVAAMPFVVCLLLGAILSATDPVAVVAIFKDLGAPKRLAVLVEGESLFNDATAIVLFNILAAMILTASGASFGSGLLSFLTVFFGGIAVGLAMSWVFLQLLSRIRTVAVVEVTLTISLAYLSFLVAEHYLHVSGVMAAVVSALVLGSTGRTSMSPEGWHLLKETWETIGFWANSLIFVLVGLAVPMIMSNLPPNYWLMVCVALVSAFAARAMLTYGLVPILAKLRVGMPVSTGFKTVMWWGGLRGAVSLALALSIYENTSFSLEMREFVVTLVCGFVLFTLFVNAPTVGLVMRAFRLNELSPGDLAMRARAVNTTRATITNSLPAFAERQSIDPDCANLVVQNYEKLAEGSLGADARESSEHLSDQEWLRIGLLSLIGQERQGYLDLYSAGHIAPSTARSSISHADDIRDLTKQDGLEGWSRACDAAIGFNWQFRAALTLQRRLQSSRLLGQSLADRYERLRALQIVVSDVKRNGISELANFLPEKTCDELGSLLDEREQNIAHGLFAIREQYPDYSQALDRAYLERCAIRQERDSYDKLEKDAIIGSELHFSLQEKLEERYKALSEPSPLDLRLKPLELVAKVPMFASLSGEKQAKVAGLLNALLAVPGEQIIGKGEPGDCMYFISSGAVRVDLEPEPVVVGTGAFFGEMALVNEAPRVATVSAIAYCDLLVLYKRDFDTLANVDEEIRSEIERVAQERKESL
jgi:Na+:H+ antiporter